MPTPVKMSENVKMSDSMRNPLPLSCGAILYAFNDSGELGVILGDEIKDTNVSYLPFKGCMEPGETPEITAIREINEETCGIVQLNTIKLDHKFTTKRKEYHIGLVEVPYKIVSQFSDIVKTESKKQFKEKRSIKFFRMRDLHKNHEIHPITKASLLYYKNKLDAIARGGIIRHNLINFCGISINTIKRCNEYAKLDRCTNAQSWRREDTLVT